MRKKHWTKIIPWILFLAVVAALIILPMKVRSKTEKESFEYVSATAEMRDISSSLSGGGTVDAPEKQDVTLPDGVEVTRFLVSNGEDVEEGQPVAEVDSLTVLAAVARVRDSMTALEKKITELVNSGGDASLRCIADGRVKAVYAKTGDDVRSVMIEYGSLGVVSLDGLMSADVACDTDLLTGDPVNVKCSDGKEYPGRVSLSLNGILTVTVTDDGPQLGEIVEVYDIDGSLLGAGALKVNSPWKVVAADGTVGSVNMKPGQKVGNGTILVRLRDTGATEKENCSRKHREYEVLLQDLLKMLQSGQVTAPCDGFVSGVDK
nr:efflux RND transporter periplasmic adaptor subunit [Oscillospiraceae bacterium]